MLDLKIETFLAVCSYRNFTHAANALALTQPAVSRQMKSLEEDYGVPLFRFDGRRFSLTPAGEMLYRYARTARSDEARLREKIKEQAAEPLRLGSTPTPGEYMLPGLLASYLKTHPVSHVHMSVRNTEDLLEMLDSGEIDLAVVEGNFSKKDYAYLLLSSQNYVPVAARESKFPGHTPESLLSDTLIVREPGSGNREILEYSLKRRNIALSDFAGLIETNDIKVQKALVRQGAGIAFLFEAAVAGEPEIKIPSIDGFPLRHEINIVWRKESLFDGEYLALAQYFAERYNGQP